MGGERTKGGSMGQLEQRELMSRVSAGEAEVREKQEEVIGSEEVGAVEIKGRHGARTGSS